MKLLAAASTVDFGSRLDAAVVQARALLPPAGHVVPCDSIRWDSVLRTEGGWDGAYAWAARTYDAMLVVETEEGMVGRGVYTMVEKFLAARKPVVVVRPGKFVAVTGVRLTGEDEWKSRYGVVVVQGAPEPASVPSRRDDEPAPF